MTDLNVMAAVENGLTAVKSKVDGKFSDLEIQVRTLKDQMIDIAQGQQSLPGFGMTAAKSLGNIVTDDGQLSKLRDRSAKSVIIPATGLNLKTLVNGPGDSNTTGFDTQAQRMPGVANASRRRLSLLDVLPTLLITSSTFEFIALDGFTNAAATQEQEGDLKAEQDMPTETVTAAIATIAVTLPASEQVLADNPALGLFINEQLRYGVMSKLEAELLTGAGGPGRINGLVTQATVYVPTDSNATGADALGQAAAALEADGWNPGVIVMHPTAWQSIRAERTQAGEYVASPWNLPAGPSLWDMPVVTSSSMPPGTAIVMDPAQAAMLDRQSVNVMAGYVDRQFAENCLTMRCELRAGLALFAPSSVLAVSI